MRQVTGQGAGWFLLHVEWFRAGRLAAGIGRDLVDPRLCLTQQFLAAPLQGFAALVDGDRFFQRHLAVLEALDDRFEFLERALKTQLLDISLCVFGHPVFRWVVASGVRIQREAWLWKCKASQEAEPIKAPTCAATDSFR